MAAGDGSEILIREGVELRRAGRNEAALEKFVRAYQTAHSPRAAAQLGLCEQALSQWAEADLHLTEALAAVSDPWVAGHRATIESSLATARRNLGTVRVHGSPKGALVMVNDALSGQFPEQALVRVKPGSVRISVSAAGHTSVLRQIAVSAEETKDVQIDLEPVERVRWVVGARRGAFGGHTFARRSSCARVGQ